MMSTKVEQFSAVEPHFVNMSASTTSSTTSTTGPKASVFAAKSGFVIPKNKLSGSLVPIFRGGNKTGGNDTASEACTNQVQRKTKWDPDLTQDATVIRGRALAYQTRVDQIAQQLKSETLDVRDSEDSSLVAQNFVKRSSDAQIDSEKELLEIEMGEAIGEILKLNPSYKAPADYKPLLKEAKVPIPVKEYPGYNFSGLIFGPGSDTKKRLEKETGAKVQVHGIKAITGEKVEILSPDANEAMDAYEELYVHLSADTFEKVDRAVTVIELLVSSISGNLGSNSVPMAVSTNTVNVLTQNLGTAVSGMTDTNHVVAPLTQTSVHGQIDYHNSWFRMGPTPLNFSLPVLNSPVPAQPSTSNLPSLFGPQQTSAAGHNSILQSSYFVSSTAHPPGQGLSQPYLPKMHTLGHPGPPRNFGVLNPNPLSTQPSQPQPLGPLPSTRQSTPLFSQTANVSSRPLQDLPEVAAGSSKGWSGASVSLGFTNIGHLAQPVRPQMLHPVVPQQAVVSNCTAPSNMPIAFVSGQSGPPSMPFVSGPPVGALPAVSSVLHPTQLSLPTSMRSSSPVIPVMQSPGPSINPATVSRPIVSPVASASLPTHLPRGISGNMGNFAYINQPAAIAPRPQHAGSSDFTFQPQQSQGPASLMIPRPGSQAANLHALPPRSVVQQQVPQAPSFQFGMHSSTPQPGIQAFPRPQTGNQIGLPQPHISSSLLTAPPRPPAFANSGPVSPMGLRNFVPSPQTPNMGGLFSSMQGHSLQVQQRYPAPPTRPGNFMSQNPPRYASSGSLQFNEQKYGHSTGQVYDPFAPTSVPSSQQQGGGLAKVKKQESDPEYEDLMASVGVK